jgi:hypothetical protein
MANTTIQTDVTESDVVALLVAHNLRRWNRRYMVKTWVGAGVFCLAWYGLLEVLISYSPDPRKTAISFGPLLLAPLLFVVLFSVYSFYRASIVATIMRRLARKDRNSPFRGKMTLTLTEQGFRQTGEYSEAFVKWCAVVKVISSSEAIYIYVSNNSAFIVPRRSFSSDPEFTEFRTLVEQAAKVLPPLDGPHVREGRMSGIQ